jgi:hypothetical protein
MRAQARALVTGVVCFATACGGGLYEYSSGSTNGAARAAPPGPPPPAGEVDEFRFRTGEEEARATKAPPADLASAERMLRTEVTSARVAAEEDAAPRFGGGDWDDDEAWGAGDERAESEPLAQLDETAPDASLTPPAAAQETEAEVESDAIDTSGPLLVYTAHLVLGVYEVRATQESAIEQIRAMGGFVARQTETVLVLRVPAARFQDALAAVGPLGDLISRTIDVADVTEEFRDVAIRLRNAEAMRDRLEALLQRAENVEDALAVERELQRLTELIEVLKGRQRYLADRITLSTVILQFQPLRSGDVTQPDVFRLPFDWLDDLGLQNLLRLR